MGKESREKNKRIGKEEVWWRYGKGECKEQEDARVNDDTSMTIRHGQGVC